MKLPFKSLGGKTKSEEGLKNAEVGKNIYDFFGSKMIYIIRLVKMTTTKIWTCIFLPLPHQILFYSLNFTPLMYLSYEQPSTLNFCNTPFW